MDLNRNTMKKLALLLGGVVLFMWVLDNLSMLRGTLGTLMGLVMPLIMGLCIAFILNVPMRAIENACFRGRYRKNGKPVVPAKLARAASMVLALALIIAVLIVAVFLVAPEIETTAMTIKAAIPGFIQRVQAWSYDIAERYPDIGRQIMELELDWKSISEKAFNFLQTGMKNVVGSTVGVIGSVFSGATAMVLAFIFAIYVLGQKETLARQAKRVLYAFLPERAADRTLEVCALSNRTFSNFITGQCVEAVILGCMFFITMSIFRFPYALMISVLIAITALIPLFGAFIGCAVGAVLILVSNPIQALWFVVLFFILQQLEGNLVYPRVVGTSVGLPGIWVLAAVTVGGNAYGVAGMLVMVPLASVAYALFREYVRARLRERGLPEKKFSPRPFSKGRQ